MRPCIYALCWIHPPKHTLSTAPLKDTVSVGIDVQISKYWCVDTEVLMYWYTHMWMHVFTNLRAHIANPLCQIRPPKDMSSIHSKCIDGFMSCYIHIWIHCSEELQTLSNTLTCIPCIDGRSLACSAFQFRLAATGPGRRGGARVRKPKVAFWTPLRVQQTCNKSGFQDSH